MEADGQLTHRQRARMADLNLLLEKVLETKTLTLQVRMPHDMLLYSVHADVVHLHVSRCAGVSCSWMLQWSCCAATGVPFFVML
jgi:hypothetical protein